MPHLTNLQTVRKTAKESAAETAQREGLDAVYGRGVVYVSEWTHSSVQKGCMVVGIRNMRVITSDDKHAMCSDKLEKQIEVPPSSSPFSFTSSPLPTLFPYLFPIPYACFTFIFRKT
jgi:hypothetical protein